MVQGYTLFEITHDSVKLENAKQYIYDGLNSDKLVPILDCSFPLKQIVEAHRYIESNQQNGKVYCVVAMYSTIWWLTSLSDTCDCSSVVLYRRKSLKIDCMINAVVD